MNSSKRVMLLIDADNVSADVVDQAVAQVMAAHSAIHVRRAYCTAESALANLKLFKAHSIRPIVNLSTGKNSTDIALAVDAVDLVVGERPDVVVIVSSDSDFAPLVIKLREKGCRVEGIGQQGKTGEDSKPVYDAFTDIAHRKAGSTGSNAPARKRAAAAGRRRAELPAPMPAPAAPLAAAPAPAAPVAAAPEPAQAPSPSAAPALESRRRTPRGRAKAAAGAATASPPNPGPAAPIAPAPAPRAAMPDDLRRILAVLPELARGGAMELGIAAERLRSEDLLAKHAPSTKLFRQHPDWFVLTPERQPNKVQYRGQPRG